MRHFWEKITKWHFHSASNEDIWIFPLGADEFLAMLEGKIGECPFFRVQSGKMIVCTQAKFALAKHAQAKYTEAKPTKAKFARPKHAQAKYRQVCSGQAHSAKACSGQAGQALIL